MTDTSAPLRKDAARNRQRLLDAATELFATQGLGVTLNDIAHHAGVGVGTAYRRFANKEELIEALFEERFREVADAAQRALADPDAWTAFVTFFERYLQMQLQDRGLTELVTNAPVRHEKVNRMRTEIAPMITEIVERAKRDGHLRTDIEATDIIFMTIGLTAVMDRTRQVAPDYYLRLFDVYLDGFRAEPSKRTALRVPPLTVDQTHEVTTKS
ncbi:TetR/AcrR family transcriptional regulator [Nocardioides sp. LML1-1-1.1]|uniref:TetR/AcrR family transcriptional regulator n=1 Tax=Nocardioides sp. LML1-1-1.1 TaxID=3135248 RepID=UPI00342FACF0